MEGILSTDLKPGHRIEVSESTDRIEFSWQHSISHRRLLTFAITATLAQTAFFILLLYHHDHLHPLRSAVISILLPIVIFCALNSIWAYFRTVRNRQISFCLTITPEAMVIQSYKTGQEVDVEKLKLDRLYIVWPSAIFPVEPYISICGSNNQRVTLKGFQNLLEAK